MTTAKDTPRRASGKRRQGKASPRTLSIQARQKKALELRTAGMGFQQIADELGYTNPGSAYKAVQAVLKRSESESAEELRSLHSARLELAYREVLPMLQAQLVVPEPKGISELTDGEREAFAETVAEALKDQLELRLKATDRLVKLLERESKLHGLDAPARSDVTSGGETMVVFHPTLNPDQP